MRVPTRLPAPWPLPCRYGPFWVASTLIFVTAAAGNCASYIDWTMHKPEGACRLCHPPHVRAGCLPFGS